MSTDAKQSSVRELYLQAVRMEDDEARRAFLKKACGCEFELRQRVEKLLAARAADRDNLLQRATADSTSGRSSLDFDAADLGETAPSKFEARGAGQAQERSLRGLIDISTHPMIGHYRLLEELGHGGMGTVYMAQQTKPVKRQVALKVIKPGMDSNEVIARFEAERQALAMMDHPHIARVLDGGSTDEGRPYFVMELVRGVPITEFCKRKSLPLRQRLELFVDICHAVQHAHQKGIIHRDLKPGNIMITLHDGKPVVKVIDFGVAKALHQELTERTLFTHFSQMVGTPLYMAPEQAEMSGLGVDTRSDIYSLGVVLYELLTGTTPFDRATVSKLGLNDIRKLIQEQEPQRPSARISTLKAANRSTIEDQRQVDTEGIAKQLKYEVDWIVMKALEKDRERRYETANAFAADIKRYLNDEPVEACPPSMLYRSLKLARRYRTAVIAMVIVVLTLTVATAVSSSLAVMANRAVDELGRQKQIALEAAAIAQDNEEKAMQLVYSADIKLASQYLIDGDIRRVSDLLNVHASASAGRDLRGLEWWYLKRFTEASYEDIESGEAGKTIVRFSPDDKYLVVGRDDGSLSFYDGQSLKLINRIDSQHGFVRGLDFSPDANTMASIGDDGMIRIWDLSQQQPVLSFRAHQKHGFRVFYIADGQELISCGEESDARLWDAATGQQVGSLENHSFGVEMAAMHVSSDRMRCAFQNQNGSVNVWDVKTRMAICQLDHAQHQKQGCYALCARFSPDDRYIAVGTNLNVVHLCDAQTGKRIKSFVGHKDAVQSLAFHPSGELLVSGDKAGVIRTWSLVDLLADANEREMLADQYRPFFEAHTARIWSVAFDAEGKRLLTASKDGKLRSWRGQEQLHAEIEGAQNASAVAYNCHGPEFLFAGKNELKRWQVKGGVLSKFRTRFAERAICVAAEPDGRRCLTGHVGGIVRTWDLSTEDIESNIRVHQDSVIDMAISDDGRMLATGCWDGTAKLWDLSNFSEIASFDLNGPHCYAIAISPRNRFLACATESLAIVFDVQTGQTVHVLEGHLDSVRSVAFSPDGTMVATASADRTFRLWNTDTGGCLHVLPAHLRSIKTMVFSPDGRTLIGADESGVVSFSNVRTGQFLFRRKVSENEILHLALSPDARHLALAIKNTPAMLIRFDAAQAMQPQGGRKTGGGEDR